MKDEGVNRALLLTPPGMAAIAVVRLAGPGVGSFLSQHFSKAVPPNRCVHGRLMDGDRVIDDPVIVLHEDRADINLHGGIWIVQECLNLARGAGFEVIEAADDLVNGQSVIEREMHQALPHARTEAAIRALLAQPRLWASSFILHPAGLSLSKASAFDPARVREILEDRSLFWMLNPPRIAIVGIPNVGKSTLANQLFGTHRSITADVPGTTRDWVGDWANIDGLAVHLLDTPGQRASSDPIEQQAIARSRVEIESADLVILVLDPTQPLEPGQVALRARYPQAISVINKCDLPTRWDTASSGLLHISAIRGDGIDELRGRIFERFGNPAVSPDRPRWWTRRQREELTQILTTKQGQAVNPQSRR